MKFLFKLIFIPIFTIVIIPLIFLAIMYKSVEIPVDDFDTSGTSINLSGMINDEFDAFLENPSHDSSLSVDLSQKDVNSLLLNQFRQMNAQYLDDNAPDDKRLYVMQESMVGYQGSWIRFKDDTIEIESGIHAFISSFTFKTRLLLVFKANIDTDEVVLKLDKVNVGNLPLAWLFGVVDWAFEKATGDSIELMINEQLKGLATFDPKTREIRMDVNDLIQEAFADDEQTKVLVNSLITFVKENELVDIGFSDETFGASLGLGKIWEQNFNPYVVPAHLRINNETELQAVLANRASTLILSTLSSSEDLFIDIDEVTLNRIFDYFLRDSRLPSGAIQEQEIMPGYLMKILMPYVSIANSEFTVNIPLIIEKVGFEATHSFESIIRIAATTSVSEGDLLINLLSIKAGNGEDPLTLEGAFLSDILALIGDGGGFIQDGAFVVEDFYSQLDSDTLSIKDISIVGSNLRMFIEIVDLGLPIQEIQEAIQSVLEVLDNPEYAEISDAIDDVLAALMDPELDPSEVEQALNDLLSGIENLEPEQQQALYEDMLNALENLEDFDYEDLFNLIP
jgi:hypothetical protein